MEAEMRGMGWWTCVLVLVGCAHTKVSYSPDGANWSTERGIPSFSPTGYTQLLVVARGDKEVKAELVTVPTYPDQPNLFFKPVAGLGANTLGLTLSNGIATGVNQSADAQIDELVAAVGGVATGVGGVLGGAGTLATGQAALLALQEGVDDWYGQLSATLVQAVGNAQNTPALLHLDKAKAEVDKGAAHTLASQAKIGGHLTDAAAALLILCPEVSAGGEACLARSQVDLAKKKLAAALPMPSPTKGVSVFELTLTGGKLTLTPVGIGS
jgi:hypothetical protein